MGTITVNAAAVNAPCVIVTTRTPPTWTAVAATGAACPVADCDDDGWAEKHFAGARAHL